MKRLAPLAPIAALAGIGLLVLFVRSLGFEWVFVGDDVVFPPADPQYHLRRAFYTFERFPSVLLFDHYINFPGGAPVPWPPLFDFVIGGMAHLFVGSVHGFEVLAAWAPPVFALLAILPIHASGRLLGCRRVALLAPAVFALLPIGVGYTRLGNVDHHAAVATIGACLLLLCLRAAVPGAWEKHGARFVVALFLARLALLSTWHGSLLYLALTEATLLLVAASSARRAVLRVQWQSAAATVACLIPILLASPTPLLGDYSSIALSWLHVIAMLAVVTVAGGLDALEAHRPSEGVGGRIGRMAAMAIGFVAVVLCLPGPRAGLLPAFQFLTMSDGVGQVTGEQSPLFSFLGREAGRPAVVGWGFFAYLIPLAPIHALVLGLRRMRSGVVAGAALLVLAGWGFFFGALSILQRRYGNDFGPAASLLFALLLVGSGDALARLLRGRGRERSMGLAIAVVLAVALIWPAVERVYLPRFASSRAAWSAGRTVPRPVEQGVANTLTRFLKRVRSLTPETSGYLDGRGDGSAPEYGIVTHANIGHAVQYEARRATATDPFWAYIGQQNWDRSFAFLSARDEAAALQLADELRARFVITLPGAEPSSVVWQLHAHDGNAVGKRRRLERFRLVVQAPLGGKTISEIFAERGDTEPPYRLFEIVPGAVLEVEATPGSRVYADLAIAGESDADFHHRARALAGPRGIARMRVPYATDTTGPVRARGPWRIHIEPPEGEGEAVDREVHVPDAAVRQGATVRVSADRPEPQSMRNPLP